MKTKMITVGRKKQSCLNTIDSTERYQKIQEDNNNSLTISAQCWDMGTRGGENTLYNTNTMRHYHKKCILWGEI